MSWKWYFETGKEASDFGRGEARFNESYMVGYEEQTGLWYCEIFGRKDGKKLYYGIGIA